MRSHPLARTTVLMRKQLAKAVLDGRLSLKKAAAEFKISRQSAGKWVKRYREDDLIARLGGDEFAVFLPRSNQLIAETVIGRLQHEIRKLEFNWQGKCVRISASIGLYPFATGECQATEMMKKADLPCYEAKASGRDCVRSFCPTPSKSATPA